MLEYGTNIIFELGRDRLTGLFGVRVLVDGKTLEEVTGYGICGGLMGGGGWCSYKSWREGVMEMFVMEDREWEKVCHGHRGIVEGNFGVLEL